MGKVRLDALPNTGLPGIVFAVRPNVDVAKATAIAKVRLTSLAVGGEAPAASLPSVEGGPSGGPTAIRLFPGMNGRVNFLAHALDAKTLAAPAKLEVGATAVTKVAGGTSVLVVDKEGKVTAAPVTVSGSDGDRVVLKDGPVAGTLVVASPEGVSPGDRVKPKE